MSLISIIGKNVRNRLCSCSLHYSVVVSTPTMFRHLLILAVICSLKQVNSDTTYRLNTPIKPLSYEILITPYFDTGDERQFTFDGEVTITLTTDTATNQIKLHSENLTFSASDITVFTGPTTISLSSANALEFDEHYTFAYINLASQLQPGVQYNIRIEYRGPIRDDLNGFYRNSYMENGVKKWLGTTQMESTHARKAFPCFDEPELKATFTLSIDRPVSYQPTLANMQLQSTMPLSNGYVRETFYPSPRMSTYLVAFQVSEFIPAQQQTTGTKEFAVYTRPEAANHTLFAFDFGRRVVDALGEYFGIDYYSSDIHLKLDHVALPDFRAGAMENWGLVTYREGLLLYIPEESSPYYKYRAAQILAHETTHMWFGNLVTCHWWSNTWLNEGFANYFQDYITALIEPDLGSADILVTGSVYSAYNADNNPDSAAITNEDVNSPEEISGHFGTITYQKAGSVIRMMHHLLGDQAFKFGLNTYLETNKFNSGYPDRMYSALNQGVTSANALSTYPGHTIADIMSSWISQAGHPIVQVDINYDNDTVTLTQKRFYISSQHESSEIYKIPITYTTERSPDFSNTKPNFIMDTKSYTFTITNISQDHSWVLFNVQETGLYRVNYDDHTWEIISSALKGDRREEIHHLNRAKIVNDLFAFLYADEVKFDRLHDVLEFLSSEDDYSVWFAAISGLNSLRNSYLGTDALDNVENYAKRLLTSIIDKLGYDVNPNAGNVALRNRMQVLEFACRVGHQGCIEHSVALFNTLRANGTEITPSLRPVAYCNGLRFGNGDDYEFLWQRMRTTNIANEAIVIGVALGCTRDEDKLKKYLVSMLEENSPIRTQDYTVPLTSILAHYTNIHFVLEELEQNYGIWSNIYPSMDTVLNAVASALHAEQEFSEFERFLTSCSQCSVQTVTSARKALDMAKSAASWANSHKADVLQSLPSGAYSTVPSMTMLVICMITAAYFKF